MGGELFPKSATEADDGPAAGTTTAAAAADTAQSGANSSTSPRDSASSGSNSDASAAAKFPDDDATASHDEWSHGYADTAKAAVSCWSAADANARHARTAGFD